MTENTTACDDLSCANCGDTIGRIEAGGYYCGRPVCDACSEYAETHRGEPRPVR